MKKAAKEDAVTKGTASTSAAASAGGVAKDTKTAIKDGVTLKKDDSSTSTAGTRVVSNKGSQSSAKAVLDDNDKKPKAKGRSKANSGKPKGGGTSGYAAKVRVSKIYIQAY